MYSPFSLEVYAQDLIRDRRRAAEHAALLALLPPGPGLRPVLAARAGLAHALRALAVRLDPCSAHEPSLATATSR